MIVAPTGMKAALTGMMTVRLQMENDPDPQPDPLPPGRRSSFPWLKYPPTPDDPEDQGE